MVSGYCRSFYSDDEADRRNIVLKENHTAEVVSNMADLARSLGLDERQSMLSGLIALFHDVGRFPQYRKYRTFRDSISVNHAALGVRVLKEQRVLERLAPADAKAVLSAVALHNVFSLPAAPGQEVLLFSRMIRDADKLDIWRVFIDYFNQPPEERAEAAVLGLPDRDEYSRDVLASLRRKELVHLSSLRTLNDFKLLQLAWIFDLNFPRSLQLLLERSYIDRLAASLPENAEIEEAVNSVREYARNAAAR